MNSASVRKLWLEPVVDILGSADSKQHGTLNLGEGQGHSVNISVQSSPRNKHKVSKTPTASNLEFSTQYLAMVAE